MDLVVVGQQIAIFWDSKYALGIDCGGATSLFN